MTSRGAAPPVGSVPPASIAASAIAGAVLRATGSRISDRAVAATAPSWRSTSSAWAALATTIGGANASPPTRCAVICSIVSCAVSASSCLGRSGRLIGHSRVPDPPDRMTGTIGWDCDMERWSPDRPARGVAMI